jgi:hypothetical protein
MEPLEFDFMRETVRGFLDPEIPMSPRYTKAMSKIQSLKREIRKLDERSLGAFRSWFLEYDLEEHDPRIQRDSRSGKLKKPSDEALSEPRSGKTRPL